MSNNDKLYVQFSKLQQVRKMKQTFQCSGMCGIMSVIWSYTSFKEGYKDIFTFDHQLIQNM